MIPIYRAKKIDSDEYVEGFYIEANYGNHSDKKEHLMLPSFFLQASAFFNLDYERIDPSTLAIHFPDMIDSNGTKIFASLSEDGKGGSILYDSYNKYNMYIKYANGKILMPILDCDAITNRLDYRTQELDMHRFRLQDKIKVTGIQE